MHYYHVDVFSEKPMNGNGLTVVFPDKHLETGTLLKIARELRQFETIFIFPPNTDGSFPARIFTMEEELTFAGHPILGAGAVLHRLSEDAGAEMQIRLRLPEKDVEIHSQYRDSAYLETMDQGIPQWISTVGSQFYQEIAESLSLEASQIDKRYPIEVVSTGLPYLLVPLGRGIGEAKISHPKFEAFLNTFGAKFVYVFETATLECRSWDNFGMVEDVATGSAAGPLCAYLVRNGFKKAGEMVDISQGKYVGRPSVIQAWVDKKAGHVWIQGNVVFFGRGELG
ncbi:MAG TPA: PhzF family phenazine biosynthesis protein [Firmicutes bacterium]|jgi:trans-2,3-dihydro-3-hydroxyanthranilate isomerase|nr:PhzF family phenazine biosynthesis protein [Bacillota bacterium]